MILQLYGDFLWWLNKRIILNRFNRYGVHEIYKLKWMLLELEKESRLYEEVTKLINLLENKLENRNESNTH